MKILWDKPGANLIRRLEKQMVTATAESDAASVGQKSILEQSRFPWGNLMKTLSQTRPEVEFRLLEPNISLTSKKQDDESR